MLLVRTTGNFAEQYDDQPYDDERDYDAANDEPQVDLAFFLREGGAAGEIRRAGAALFQIAQADAARDDHGGILLFSAGCGWSWSRTVTRARGGGCAWRLGGSRRRG